jgi:hypothetical protein
MKLYPKEYRLEFSEEMAVVFEELWAERKGWWARGEFCLREGAGLLRGAVREHLQVLVRGRFEISSRRFEMRDGFRFPKSTAILMVVILAGVVMAILKGEAIEASVPYTNLPVGPIQPVHSTLLPPLVWMFAVVYAAALAGWAILFALRRSGVHRLDGVAEK